MHPHSVGITARTLANFSADFVHNYTMNNLSARRPLASILNICDLNEDKIYEVSLDGSFRKVNVSCTGSDPHSLFPKIQREKSFENILPADEFISKLKELSEKHEVIDSYLRLDFVTITTTNLKGELAEIGKLNFLNA